MALPVSRPLRWEAERGLGIESGAALAEPRSGLPSPLATSRSVSSISPRAFSTSAPKTPRGQVALPSTGNQFVSEQAVRALGLELEELRQEWYTFRAAWHFQAVEAVVQSCVEKAMSSARMGWESRFTDLEESVKNAMSKESVARSIEIQKTCADLDAVLREAISSAVESDREVYVKGLAETHASMVVHGTYVVSRLEEFESLMVHCRGAEETSGGSIQASFLPLCAGRAQASPRAELLDRVEEECEAQLEDNFALAEHISHPMPLPGAMGDKCSCMGWESRFKNLEESVQNAMSKESAARSVEIRKTCADLDAVLREAISSAVKPDREVYEKDMAETHAAMVTYGTYVVSRLEEFASLMVHCRGAEETSGGSIQALCQALCAGRAQASPGAELLDRTEETCEAHLEDNFARAEHISHPMPLPEAIGDKCSKEIADSGVGQLMEAKFCCKDASVAGELPTYGGDSSPDSVLRECRVAL